MKFSNNYWIVITIFLLIVVMSLYCCSATYSPYYKDTIFPRYSPYEGFNSPIVYTDHESHKALDDTYLLNAQVPVNVDCKKVAGLNGLFCAPNTERKVNDPFSSAKGDLTSTSGSGLTNSKGSLVLSDSLIKQLSTRGGNASSGEFEIGA